MSSNGDLTVPMDARLRRWVDQRIREGGYRDAGEYIQDLIQRDLSLVSEDEINEQLQRAIDSGDAGPVDAEYWQQIRRQLAERVAGSDR